MNFAVDKKHRDVFRKQQWIELEGLLTPAQAGALLKESFSIITDRANVSKSATATWPAETRFLYGHDLWRAAPLLKRTVLDKKYAEAAASIIEAKQLRIGYDQFYNVPEDGKIGIGAYSTLLSSTPTLQEISSIQGVLCGLVLCIEEGKLPLGEELSSSLFSLTAGHGVLFGPDLPIPFAELKKRPGYSYLMIVYTVSKAVFILQDSAPHQNEFKKLGYSFNDKLNDVLNPLVYH